jgi:hypothetical protein
MCLHVAALSPCDVLEAPAGDVEHFVYRHIRVLVTAVEFVAFARRGSSCRFEDGFVIDDYISTRQ